METLIVDRADGVVTVTMNRPDRKNAANGKMLVELRAIFEEVEDTPDDRAMILTGAGGAFCSGADLTDPSGPATDPTRSGLSRMRRLGDVALALHHVSKPTIAKVDGFAVGAGLSLALGCDLIVCSDRAKLSMIFSKRSLALDNGASWLLPRLVGLARAKEIALFGGMWSGEEALAIGLVNRLGPHPGRRPPAGPLHDQDPAPRQLQRIDGAGAGGRSPLPGTQLLDQGHGGGHGRLRPEAGAHVHRPLIEW
jgi:2-(1,2-epoxy-1,2-dihydrophenyl)acetyl-CoA isomerase